MKKIVFIMMMVVISSCYCHAGVSIYVSKHNNEINSRIREQIHILNEQIIKSLKDNEPKVLYDLYCEELKK